MASYESKISFYSASSRYSLHQVCSFAFCVCYMHISVVLYQILSHHQNQLQTNANAIDIQKYKKDVFPFLYILATSVQSYVPLVCCVAVVRVAKLLLNWRTLLPMLPRLLCFHLRFFFQSFDCSIIGV